MTIFKSARHVNLIELDLKDVAKAREADPSQGLCTYSGPCAIGVMMSEAQRDELAAAGLDGDNITSLILAGVVSVPSEQVMDFARLQRAFDNPIEPLANIIAELEERYV